MIEPDLAELVDDYDGAGECFVLQQAVKQGRLAGTEKAGQHSEGNWLCGGPQVAAGAHFLLASGLLGSDLVAAVLLAAVLLAAVLLAVALLAAVLVAAVL